MEITTGRSHVRIFGIRRNTMAKNKRENFLDYIPKRNALYEWEFNQDKHVEVLVKNRGLFNRAAQLLFRKPKVSRIELDDMGGFIWQQLDGKRTIFEIGADVKKQFGKKAEPLYERLCEYIKILHNNGFIVYENKKRKGRGVNGRIIKSGAGRGI